MVWSEWIACRIIWTGIHNIGLLQVRQIICSVSHKAMTAHQNVNGVSVLPTWECINWPWQVWFMHLCGSCYVYIMIAIWMTYSFNSPFPASRWLMENFVIHSGQWGRSTACIGTRQMVWRSEATQLMDRLHSQILLLGHWVFLQQPGCIWYTCSSLEYSTWFKNCSTLVVLF